MILSGKVLQTLRHHAQSAQAAPRCDCIEPLPRPSICAVNASGPEQRPRRRGPRTLRARPYRPRRPASPERCPSPRQSSAGWSCVRAGPRGRRPDEGWPAISTVGSRRARCVAEDDRAAGRMLRRRFPPTFRPLAPDRGCRRSRIHFAAALQGPQRRTVGIGQGAPEARPGHESCRPAPPTRAWRVVGDQPPQPPQLWRRCHRAAAATPRGRKSSSPFFQVEVGDGEQARPRAKKSAPGRIAPQRRQPANLDFVSPRTGRPFARVATPNGCPRSLHRLPHQFPRPASASKRRRRPHHAPRSRARFPT